MYTLEDVKDMLSKAQVTDTFGTKKEINELPNLLKENEIINYATSGFVDSNTFLIVCTDKRILFVDKGLLYGLKTIEIPLDKVNSVSYKTGLVFGEITVYHGSSSQKIDKISKETVGKMAMAIQDATEAFSANEDALNRDTSTANSTTSVNSFDDLKKLKELLDMGAITQEEFDLKKKKILDL